MDLSERRDHILEMLAVIARDLDRSQTKAEQVAKAQGTEDTGDESAAAISHGRGRAISGFSIAQLVSEFRALRASVLRLWSEVDDEPDRAKLQEATRFNEAIDQLLAVSVAKYSRDLEQSKELLLGVIAHDLRNPLGSIMMGASMALTRAEPSSPDARTASRALASVARMEEIIGDLLDFSNARFGTGMPVTLVDTDIEAVCRQVVDEIAAFHPDSDVRVVTSGAVHGQWDGARIGQLISNLVGNAYQHGAPDAAIEVAIRGEPEQVVLAVHNSGSMIAARDLPHIFDPFRQLKPSSAKSRGSRSAGLGLFIVQAIVAAHHGTIDVESTERGTTFTVRLPRHSRNDARSDSSTAQGSVH